MGELLLGCSGWNYPDTPDKGGWTGVFYPDKDTKRLRYYSQFFNTAEMDSSFYEKFYSQMTKGTFIGMSRATPEKFSTFLSRFQKPLPMLRDSMSTKGLLHFLKNSLIKYLL
jgi:hypothetical protein